MQVTVVNAAISCYCSFQCFWLRCSWLHCSWLRYSLLHRSWLFLHLSWLQLLLLQLPLLQTGSVSIKIDQNIDMSTSLILIQPCIDAFFGWKIGISVAKTGWVAGQNHHQLQLLSALKVISKWIFFSLLRKNSHIRIFSAMENRICILFFIIIVIASKVNGSNQSMRHVKF